MAKTKIDTSIVPGTLTAHWIKRFFKERHNIPVRVNSINRANGSGFVSVWIMSDRSGDHRHGLVYKHDFPPELGNRCLKLVYPTSEKLCAQDWAGNVQKHRIAMSGSEFRQLFNDLNEADDEAVRRATGDDHTQEERDARCEQSRIDHVADQR